MNLNASPETIRDVAETLKYAAFLDDRVAQADKARIAAWSEQIQRHHLQRDDLLDGLQAFYDGPSQNAIQIGDLIHHGRNARRNRNEREDDELRDARAARRDTQAADEIQTVSASVITGRVKSTPRLNAAREALENCTGKTETLEAMREYFIAKREARKA